MKIDGIILKNLNHKINRKAMLQAEIERETERAHDGFAGAWETVCCLWEAFDETLHAVAGYDDCLPGDEVSRDPSITGAMWQWDTDSVSPCLFHWRERNGLVSIDIRENSEREEAEIW